MVLVRTRFKTLASPSAESVFIATRRTTKSKVFRVDLDIVVVFLLSSVFLWNKSVRVWLFVAL